LAELGEKVFFQVLGCELVKSRALGPIFLLRVQADRLDDIRQEPSILLMQKTQTLFIGIAEYKLRGTVLSI